MPTQQKTTPVHIQTLFHALDGDAAATAFRMGIHPSTVNRAIQTYRTTFRQEAKAEIALAKLREEQRLSAEQSSDPTQFFVSVPIKKLEAFKRVSAALGAEMVPL